MIQNEGKKDTGLKNLNPNTYITLCNKGNYIMIHSDYYSDNVVVQSNGYCTRFEKRYKT